VIFPDRQFLKHALTLALGTGVSQLIPVVAAPAITRLYNPSDFGTFALFLGSSSVAAIISTARFEQAVQLPSSETDANNLVSLALTVSFVASLFGAILIEVFLDAYKSLSWVRFVPAMTLLFAWYQTLTYWLNRHEQFRRVAINRISRSIFTVIITIGLAYSGRQSVGLILGVLFAQLLTTLPLLISWLKTVREIPISLGQMRDQAIRYKAFALYSLPGDTVNSAAGQLPTFFLASFFSQATVGLYGLTHRICSAPNALIASAIGDVFRQKAAIRMRTHGEFRQTWLSTFTLLGVIAVIPFTILVAFAPTMFAIAFGEQWRDAGVYAQVLSPFYFFSFIASVLGRSTSIAERQQADMVWQIALFILLSAALHVGASTASPSTTLLLYSLSYSAMYLVYLAMSFKYSRGLATVDR
jgi:O-antigen/teichoic acid export membrane protein